MVNAGAGKCTIIKSNEVLVFESNLICCSVDKTKAEPLFYFYFFNSNLGRLLIDTIIQGTQSRSLKSSELVNLEIPLPPMLIQRKISEYFFVMDLLIIKLQEINRILEKIIQSIFKSWFVDFDGQTEFVDSELGEIPKGWKVEKLAEHCDIETGKLNSNAAIDDGKYFFFTCDKENFKINTFSHDCEAILLAGNNAVGEFSVKYFKGKFDVYQRTYVLTIKKSSKIGYAFLLYTLKRNLELFQSISVGTATRFLTLKILQPFPLLIPDDIIIRKFNTYTKAILNIILENNKEIGSLTKIRDYLLPKLMSGEIRV
jgi:type I restriction enzyme, S subunit